MRKFELGDICVYRAGFGKLKKEYIVKVVHDGGRGVYRVRKLGYPLNSKQALEEQKDDIWWATEDSLSKLE